MLRVGVPLTYTEYYKLLRVMREPVPTNGERKGVDIEPTIR